MSSKQRTPLARFDDIPGELPQATLPEDVELDSVSQNALLMLNSLQEDHLAPNAIWRDLLALTGTYRTFYSPSKVFDIFKRLSKQKERSVCQLKTGKKPRIGKAGPPSSWVDVDVIFTAQHANLPENCAGTVSVIKDEAGRWKIWMLRTWLECFDGRGHPDLLSPSDSSRAANGLPDGASHAIDEEYGAIVVGGGQAGLSVAGRLKALGIRYLLLEKRAEIGDVWAERYESLRWHTSKEYGNLPFGRTFDEDDDYMVPTKRIGAGHKNWSQKYGINAKTKTIVESATWDDASQKWTVKASTPDGQISLIAKDLVLAIGPGHGRPVYPSWATEDRVLASGFKGTILHAFNGYDSVHQWAGKRGIVIGTANTAHDVAEDMANAGMKTTMVQRNPTFIFPAVWLHTAQDHHYNADMHPDAADRESFTYPNKIMRETINRGMHAGIKATAARFDTIEKAGFKLDRFGDIYNNLYVRFGGHYVDIGCSDRIASGEISMETSPVKGLTADGLAFENGKEVGADLIVLCTGFEHDFRIDAAQIVGPKVADQMDDFWGVDAEGELRGLAKPAGHPNLYYHGGDVRIARFFSRFIALQIQADVLGQPLEPYVE